MSQHATATQNGVHGGALPWSPDSAMWGRDQSWEGVNPDFRRSPSPISVPWDGMNGQPHGTSFVVLTGIPRHVPEHQLANALDLHAIGGFIQAYKFSSCACKTCSNPDAHDKFCYCLPCNFPHVHESWGEFFFESFTAAEMGFEYIRDRLLQMPPDWVPTNIMVQHYPVHELLPGDQISRSLRLRKEQSGVAATGPAGAPPPPPLPEPPRKRMALWGESEHSQRWRKLKESGAIAAAAERLKAGAGAATAKPAGKATSPTAATEEQPSSNAGIAVPCTTASEELPPPPPKRTLPMPADSLGKLPPPPRLDPGGGPPSPKRAKISKEGQADASEPAKSRKRKGSSSHREKSSSDAKRRNSERERDSSRRQDEVDLPSRASGGKSQRPVDADELQPPRKPSADGRKGAMSKRGEASNAGGDVEAFLPPPSTAMGGGRQYHPAEPTAVQEADPEQPPLPPETDGGGVVEAGHWEVGHWEQPADFSSLPPLPPEPSCGPEHSPAVGPAEAPDSSPPPLPPEPGSGYEHDPDVSVTGAPGLSLSKRGAHFEGEVFEVDRGYVYGEGFMAEGLDTGLPPGFGGQSLAPAKPVEEWVPSETTAIPGLGLEPAREASAERNPDPGSRSVSVELPDLPPGLEDTTAGIMAVYATTSAIVSPSQSRGSGGAQGGVGNGDNANGGNPTRAASEPASGERRKRTKLGAFFSSMPMPTGSPPSQSKRGPPQPWDASNGHGNPEDVISSGRDGSGGGHQDGKVAVTGGAAEEGHVSQGGNPAVTPAKIATPSGEPAKERDIWDLPDDDEPPPPAKWTPIKSPSSRRKSGSRSTSGARVAAGSSGKAENTQGSAAKPSSALQPPPLMSPQGQCKDTSHRPQAERQGQDPEEEIQPSQTHPGVDPAVSELLDALPLPPGFGGPPA